MHLIVCDLHLRGHVQRQNGASFDPGILSYFLDDCICIYEYQRIRILGRSNYNPSGPHAIFCLGYSDCDVWTLVENAICSPGMRMSKKRNPSRPAVPLPWLCLGL